MPTIDHDPLSAALRHASHGRLRLIEPQPFASLADTAADDPTPPVHEPRLAALGPLVDLACTASANPEGVGRLRRAARRRRVRDMCSTYLWRGVAIGWLLGALFGGVVIGIVRGLL